MQSPSLDDDRAILTRADELLRNNPARYWQDIELQDAAFEARERLGGPDPAENTTQPSQRASQDRQRVQEIEALLRDPNGDGHRRYWTDAELRTEYAEALARLHGGIDTVGSQNAEAAPATPENAGIAPVIA
jgi:hypothetical protein